MQSIGADLAALYLFDDRFQSRRADVGAAVVAANGCEAAHPVNVADSRMCTMKRKHKDANSLQPLTSITAANPRREWHRGTSVVLHATAPCGQVFGPVGSCGCQVR